MSLDIEKKTFVSTKGSTIGEWSEKSAMSLVSLDS